MRSITLWRFHDVFFPQLPKLLFRSEFLELLFSAILGCCQFSNIVLNNYKTSENQSGCISTNNAVRFKQGIVMLAFRNRESSMKTMLFTVNCKFQ